MDPLVYVDYLEGVRDMIDEIRVREEGREE